MDPTASAKERYQDIEEKNERLRLYLAKPNAAEFLQRFEMSWIFHDCALEGQVYASQELAAALRAGAPAEASMQPAIFELRNHRAAVEYTKREARESANKRTFSITMTAVRHMHDLFLGNTQEAQTARAATERRERTEKELTKERDRASFRRDMPLHRTYFHDIAPPAKIQPLLEKLVETTATPEFRESHPIKQATQFHHGFLQIFPFSDHSGKVARMLANLFLMRANYLPCIIHSIDRQRYYEGLRGTATGFRSLVIEAMENSLDNGLKYFSDQTRRYRVEK